MKNTIGYFQHQRSGCFYYRTKHPMDLLGGKEISLNTDIEFYDQLKAVQVYGIYPFSFERVLTTMKADGIKIVYDIDDAFDLIDESNPFYHAVKKDAASGNEILTLADHITVATPALAEYMRTKTDKPITVIPNCYDPKEWMFPRPVREGIRIGFAGSTTHVAGLIEVLPAIAHLQERFDIKFLIMGFGQGSYAEWYRSFRFTATEKAKAQLEELDRLIREVNFEWIPFVDFASYPATLTNMALDIGICPLIETPFNKCRSASKAMEYTLAGALALASDTTAYRDTPTSVLVSEGSWPSQLEYYVRLPEEREKKRLEHLTWLQANRTIESQRDLLNSVYLV